MVFIGLHHFILEINSQLMKRFLLLFILVVGSAVLNAQTILPSFFSSGMVLQQQTKAAVWGWDKPNIKITVKGSWGKTNSIQSDARGKWKLFIETPVAGGPFELKVVGTSTVILSNVLIGEVWLCAGQSNMEMPVRGYNNQPVAGSNEAILQSSNSRIRFFNTTRATSIKPVQQVQGSWKEASPATTPFFSATAYFFAKKIHESIGVPVGIIQSAWGASTIESWMDSTTISAFPGVAIPDSLPATNPNRTPTIMYNAMLHPYIGYAIKGVLWYQGEANRENAQQYHLLFTALIQSWREQWQLGDFPFYFAQIAPFEPGKVNAAYLREAQLQTMLSVKNTGMAVTMDVGEKNVIHPADKATVGHRLAYWALAKDYGIQGIAFSGPVYKQMRVNANGRAILSFAFAEMGLSNNGKPLQHFEIAGEDKQFYPAQAVIVADKTGEISVWSDSVPKPVSVRYAFKNWAEASLFNTYGLPASSFRTDNW